MSERLISRSDDLRRLQAEGYEVEVRHGHLLIGHVPYVNGERQVKYGILVSTLTLAGDVTTRPDTHVTTFIGEAPCDRNGAALDQIIVGSDRQQLAEGITVDFMFSSKPPDGYPDYYEKMAAYIAIVSGPAQAIDPEATAQTYRVIEDTDASSVFEYVDTASSRAGIAALTDRLRTDKVAIVGLGGTGSYLLDLVAKTPVEEIHLFDGDTLLQHNAFRSPGAPSIDQLREAPRKVDYLASQYRAMRRNIIPHDSYIDKSNIDLLSEMNFVFIAIDDSEAKKVLIEALEGWGTSFIDVGMGVTDSGGSLGGLVRVTASTSEQRAHVRGRNRIPLGAPKIDDDYDQNIQIADLNALNAALAVIKWKKQAGFYLDLEHEHFSIYEIDGNHLLNEDQA